MSAAKLFVLGLGPGDPELMTVKAARILAAAPVVAFFAKRGRAGHARRIVDGQLREGAEELRFEYPFTTELSVENPRYLAEMGDFYDGCAVQLAARLQAGQDIALLCEGDPFLYGSAMYLFDRLSADYAADVVPGVTGMSGCWSRAGLPMTHGDDVLSILPATLDEARLLERLKSCDAAVVMKVGRHLPKISRVLREAGMFERAFYVERGTMEGEFITRLSAREDGPAPYFSMVLVPGRRGAR
ncbi:MAG TPA: precorrin-2 C(20)-methyltransferase [Acidocella sp.]|jgi:precorrin-2/cobalt-factor-2 C20-methyltransferase|uniref:precorrin-2 C(20)-methyltransferase n=1 Tax=Acidocella sp. TaxID=50710 RepID=UPI002C653B28|nr:precorrin-2 C(20)-methyltransferase [Acidocella sp.]HVE22776.1 precorrin-2 C(20)-methyltransferase [Acidocella sp.]